ncbi:MAG: DUF3822 family protein [Bacteroidales bacterium]|nr:DUF3822 family protein [Bacteroidales bacterium]
MPSRFFDVQEPRRILSEVAVLDPLDVVGYVFIERLDAYLVYSHATDGYPQLYYLLSELPHCPEYNKIFAAWEHGCLSLAIASGDKLLLCNTFPAEDFTTAQYFIFSAVKSLQLNPEFSTVCFRTPLGPDEEMSLYRYFKSVERL